jgi:transposase
MSKKPTIRLWSAQRRKLRRIIRTGKHSAREILHAHILLKTADGWTDQQIVEAFYTSHDTIQRTRTRFIAEGLDAALHEQSRPGAPLKLTTEQETLLIALACSKPPVGHRRWTVRLLAERAVKLKIVESIAPETIRQILKKTRSSRGS